MSATSVVLQPRGRSADRDRAERIQDETPEASLPRRLVAEAIGAFFLTFVAAGGEVIATQTRGEVSNAAKFAAPGLVVAALIYALGDVSGAHFNPAVTLAFALRGVFRWSCVPAYWIAQLLAAITAAATLRAMFGDVANLGASHTPFGTATGLVTEILLSWLLLTVILNTATRARVLGPNAAIAVGATIACCGLFAGPVSGASMNPARSLGPALVAEHATNWWIYLVGPIVGAVVAVVATHIVHPARDSKEVDAAEGEHNDTTRSITARGW